MKTAFYWPAFLGPLGKQADFWSVANLLLETLTASDIELFVDTDADRSALERLFQAIRSGRVNRLIVRSTGDLCLTVREFGEFISDVIEHRVRVEHICEIFPSVLLQGQPEMLGRFRHRQLMAKVIRLRRLGLTIREICTLARATPQQVTRILLRPR